MSRISKAAFILSVLAATAGTARASTLYGESYSGFSDSQLYSFNQTTGAATLIGSTHEAIGDLTSANGKLLGVDLITNSLLTINTTDGSVFGGVAIHGSSGVITSIAYDPGNGVLYGNTTTGFGGDDALYSIDLISGAATRIGDLGVTNVFALGFGTNGALYGADDTSDLYAINIATGAASLVGGTGASFLYDVAARPEDGVMFAADNRHYTLDTLDLATGAATSVGSYGSSLNIGGLAFIGGSVPEPASWTMMIVGLLGVGALVRRRPADAVLA